MICESLKDDPKKLASFKKIAEKRQKPWFIWELEFYDVFKNNGGFDIVIGNPPYILNSNIITEEKKIFQKKYIACNSHYDLYICFYNLALLLLNHGGILSFITSNKWLNQKYGLNLRKLILSNKLLKIINFNDIKIFESATVDTELTFVKRLQDHLAIYSPKNYDFYALDFDNTMKISTMNLLKYNTALLKITDTYEFNLSIKKCDIEIINKIFENSIAFEEICYNSLGAVVHCKESQNNKKEFISDIKLPGYKNYLEGKDIRKWENIPATKFLNYQPDKHREPRFPELFDGKKILSIRTSSKKNPHRFCINYNDYAADSVIVSKKYCDIPTDKIVINNSIKAQYVSYEYLVEYVV
jgi:adenine-specific DNA-methyltransferase